MDLDLIFVVGVIIAAFAIPSLVSAYADRRWPRQAVLMLVLGGVAIAYAMQENPGVYTAGTVDDVIVAVLGRYLN